MKKLIITIIAVTISTIIAAEGTNGVRKTRKKLTPEQTRERRARMYSRNGGRCVDMSVMKGNIQFINVQKQIADEVLMKTVKAAADGMQSDIRLTACGDINVTPVNAVKIRRDNKATAAIYLLESDAIPAFLVGPEERWAMINLRALSADNPKPEDLEKRVSREMWRALGYLFATDSMQEKCLMKPIYSLNDLDNIGIDGLSMEPFYKMKLLLPAQGIVPYKVANYRKACEEGWAPAPTDTVQKVIWDETHSIPTKPIKIEP